MALVQDDHDPSGLGMFSKAGRYTSEKYIIFQKKDEILYDKKRFSKTQSMATLPKENRETMQPLQKMKQKKAQNSKENQKGNKKEENMPFSKQLSREKISQIMAVKHPSKPVGYYQPKYTQIDRSPHQVWNVLEIYKSRHVSRVASTASIKTPLQQEEELPIPDKPRKRVAGFIDYERQIDREKVVKIIKNDPHEKRFEPLKLSITWSNMKRVPQFLWKNSLGRDDNKVYKTKEHQPDYKPNYEYGKKNLGKTVPNFAKIPSRQPFFRYLGTQNEHVYDYDFYVKDNKSNIFKSTPTICLNKMLPREADPSSPLPSFMQKHVNQRQTLSHVHYKMLEQNHFFDGRFQSTKSQFDPQATAKKKPEDEEEEDLEEQEQQQQPSQEIDNSQQPQFQQQN